MPVDIFAKWLGEWSQSINVYSILFKIVIAVLFSTILGVERATKHHDAGLRTFVMVALVSTVAGITDLFLLKNLEANVSLLSTATIVGIAIISGNTILFSSRNQIKGLTTSMGMWATAIISIALGLGLYVVATILFAVVIVVLTLFTHVEHLFKVKSNTFEVHLELKNKDMLNIFTEAVRKVGLKIDEVEFNPAYLHSQMGVYSIVLTKTKKLKNQSHQDILEALSSLDCVSYIEEIE